MRPGSAGDYWRGRRVFLTGATGFKGSWLALWLHRLGAKVHGYALAPEGESLYATARVEAVCPTLLADIRDSTALQAAIAATAPQVIFHLAAQPLVRRGYERPLDTFSTNVQGTCNVLEAARAAPSVESVVVVTTDKCYRNCEWDWGYRETDALGGADPYSASKAAAELAVAAWRTSWLERSGVRVASARAGNVVGGGDWAEGRLIPDVVRAHRSNTDLVIRYPDATRPWQHVIDCLDGYLRLAESIASRPDLAGSWNFGPPQEAEASVRRVIALMTDAMPVAVQLDEQAQPHEAGRLVLDSSRARRHLGWQPRLDLLQTLRWTAQWYQRYLKGEDALTLTLDQLDAWEHLGEGAP